MEPGPQPPDQGLQGPASCPALEDPRCPGDRVSAHPLVPQPIYKPGKRDAHRAHLGAGPAQGRSRRQLALASNTLKLGLDDGTDGAGIDGPIGVTAEADIDRAVVDAGRATNATQPVPELRIGVDARAPIVQQDQVDLPRAVLLTRPPRRGDHVEVGGDGLPSGRADQQGQQGWDLVQACHHLLDPHDGDVHLRRRGAHAPVALVLHQTQGPSLGHREVDAG